MRIILPQISEKKSRWGKQNQGRAADLRRLHLFLRTYHWFARVLKKNLPHLSTGLLIGAGEGFLGRFLYNDPLLREKIEIIGLDIAPRPVNWPLPWKWIHGELLKFDGWNRYSFILANWVFYAYDDQDLKKIGEKILDSNASLLVFAEPYRSRIHSLGLLLFSTLGLIRSSYPEISTAVQAGFQGRELIEALRLEDGRWNISLSSPFWISQRLVARRF
ncbi:hypothetical protein EM20IM_06900 [Candidatus Methylacidiphilum infernorum]|uniref:SAM-dependent methyltransferase n=1 Tax=Candidatus Methylacidiphilum infernorum TaxID=511746 RepID=A0ABX7PTU0_9BACT|nr:hypothetical protein [Candidatus Methylacidiphilum infernorum]QSR86230.1 hypothetical protein EM20IM_06900 [Candidatus Methylacidiphilum infernorum]